jgi:hypothetical protein
MFLATSYSLRLGGMMKTLLRLGLLTALVLAAASASAQTYKSHIEHPIVRCQMQANLDPVAKKVTGHYTLTWWNHTGDTIPDLRFHMYLNAFKNLDSTFSREEFGHRRRRDPQPWERGSEEGKWGWVDVNKLQIVGGADLTPGMTFIHPDDDNDADQSVMRVALPQPIPPNGTIELAVDFTAQLPRSVARNGYEGDYFLLAQWFPKIGVYEGAGERGRKEGGWNCHQYHAHTEFYADYGVYDVELTAPSNYVVGATGFRLSEQRNSDGTTTYHQYQEDVHDFAWTACPRFVKVTRTFDWRKEVSGEEINKWAGFLNVPPEQEALRDVSVTLLVRPGHVNITDRYFRSIFAGLKYFGLWYGQYPYDTLTVVDTPRNSATCCMEYPTFITVGTSFWPGEHSFSPEGVTVHEFGHQFWYGLVGNNEFEEAFLDEGFNTYSTGKVLETAYGAQCSYERVLGVPIPSFAWLEVPLPAFPFAGVPSIPIGPYFSCVQTPERTADRGSYLENAKSDDLTRFGWEYLNGASYGNNSYGRVGLTLRTLESYLGEQTMARVMRAYHQRWRYRHPCLEDFITAVNEVSGQNMNWFSQEFFHSSNVADYTIDLVKSEVVEGKLGVYDVAGKKQTFSEKETPKGAAKDAKKQYHSTVTVRRLGETLAPVDILVRFENGETAWEQWNGQYRWVRYTYLKPTKVVSAEVDPARKLALEANFTNNSRTEEEDNRAAAKWYVRWIFWLENLFFSAGFFS